MNSDLTALYEAINNEGSHPGYHREIMAKHRKEWPTLWKAIDDLLAKKEEEDG